jgi:hypothetical protein
MQGKAGGDKAGLIQFQTPGNAQGNVRRSMAGIRFSVGTDKPRMAHVLSTQQIGEKYRAVCQSTELNYEQQQYERFEMSSV